MKNTPDSIQLEKIFLHHLVGGDSSKQFVAVIRLVRPDVANALSFSMIENLKDIFEQLSSDPNVKAVVLSGTGKHFSAGADLEWMRQSQKLSLEENFLEAKTLQNMFEAFFNLPCPAISIVKGSSFGGALGLIAASDIVIAESSARFCLSEVKLGILPAVILPYLSTRIHPGQLRRLSLTARLFNADLAQTIGLVDIVAKENGLGDALIEELKLLCLAGTSAQRRLKKLIKHVNPLQIDHVFCQQIAEARISEEGQEGLKSFFEKREASWRLVVDQDKLKSMLNL